MPDPESPPATAHAGDDAKPDVIAPVVCLVCGCLCDDLAVMRAGGRVVDVDKGCDVARGWFLGHHAEERDGPEALVQGRPAERSEAAAEAARLLAAARAPLIVGLGHSTQQTVAAAARLADRIGAVIDPTGRPGSAARNLALARAGRVSATLGEVKNRSDVVLFWGADPVRSHPRHWERYSVLPAGRFVPDGRAGRTVIVVDDQRTATSEQSDLFVEIDRSREFEILWTLRAVIKGVELDASRVRATTGMELESLQRLASLLRGARHGAFFHAPRFTGVSLGASAAVIEAAGGLVRELSRHTRFVLLNLGEPGNAAGAESVLTWQTGFPMAVDFASGFPVSIPGATTAQDRLERGEADMVLVVGPSGLEPSVKVPEGLPAIVVAPPGTAIGGWFAVRVRLHAATTGLHEPGTVQRSDGISLPLRPVIQPRYPSEREWLDAIFGHLPRTTGTEMP